MVKGRLVQNWAVFLLKDMPCIGVIISFLSNVKGKKII